MSSRNTPKRKNRTSTAAVNRYNQKTYKQFAARVKPELLQQIDAYLVREGISKPEFLARAISVLDQEFEKAKT